MRPTTCARPACPCPAAAWLTYDYGAQRVWLDDRPGPAGDQWGLCDAHAARLRAPRGWAQVDRRTGARGAAEPPVTLVS
ncbi:MAG: DUF3499 family protein [Acidimicrobiales bacterium]